MREDLWSLCPPAARAQGVCREATSCACRAGCPTAAFCASPLSSLVLLSSPFAPGALFLLVPMSGRAPGKAGFHPAPPPPSLPLGLTSFRVNKSQKENESQWCLNYYCKQMLSYDMFANVWIFHMVNLDGKNEKLWLILLLMRWTQLGFWKRFFSLCTE